MLSYSFHCYTHADNDVCASFGNEYPWLASSPRQSADCYDLGNRLLLVSSDRISAFDWVLPTGIPDKGRVLTQFSAFWFGLLGETNHMLSIDARDFGLPAGADPEPLAGRSMLVRKTEVVPIECVVRGIFRVGLEGIRKQRARCAALNYRLVARKRQVARADFHAGHQGRNRTRHQYFIRTDGGYRRARHAEELRARSFSIYQRGADLARRRGHHHRRHEVRMGASRRKIDSDRRSADARQFAILACRPIRAGAWPAIVRQAVCARLAGNNLVGQK